MTGFHTYVEKGGYDSNCRGTTFGVMRVLIGIRALLGISSFDSACHVLKPARSARAHQPSISPARTFLNGLLVFPTVDMKLLSFLSGCYPAG